MIPGVIPNSGARLLYYYPHCTVAWRSLDHVENMVLVLVVASAEDREHIVGGVERLRSLYSLFPFGTTDHAEDARLIANCK